MATTTIASHWTRGFSVQIESIHSVTPITVIQWFPRLWYCLRVHLVSWVPIMHLNSFRFSRGACSRMKIWIRSSIIKETRRILICIIWIITIKTDKLVGHHNSNRRGKCPSRHSLRALAPSDILMPDKATRPKRLVLSSFNKLINNSNREVSPLGSMNWWMLKIRKYYWARMMGIIWPEPGSPKKSKNNTIWIKEIFKIKCFNK